MNNKKPWQSKTIVLSAIGGLLGAVALFAPGASSLSVWITSHGAEIAIGWSVLGMALRLITKDKISLGD